MSVEKVSPDNTYDEGTQDVTFDEVINVEDSTDKRFNLNLAQSHVSIHKNLNMTGPEFYHNTSLR